jgi:hypothetical protein
VSAAENEPRELLLRVIEVINNSSMIWGREDSRYLARLFGTGKPMDMDMLRAFEAYCGRTPAIAVQGMVRMLRAGTEREVASILSEEHWEAAHRTEKAILAERHRLSAGSTVERITILQEEAIVSLVLNNLHLEAEIIALIDEDGIVDANEISAVLKSREGVVPALYEGAL